jgi:molybdate transport system substrate-binding protein
MFLVRFFLFLLLSALSMSSLSSAQTVSIYAAGSLRNVMQDLKKGYATEAPFEAELLFGPSGVLRQKIETGATPALFASASPIHTDAQVKSGKLRSSVLFARNSLCVVARPGLAIQTNTVVSTLLSPNIVVGTSTPGADPAGDYTWEMFRKIDRLLQPGMFDVLDRKAKKLVGAEITTPAARSAYAELLQAGKADVFVTYCTNAASAMAEVSGISYARVPTEIDVASDYSMGIAMDAPEPARLFVRYIQSSRGQAILAQHGFSRVPQSCEDLPPKLRPAHAAWTAPATRVTTALQATGEVPIAVGSRAQLTLHPSTTLQFPRRDEAKRPGSFGGAAAFTVAADGQYEVFLDRRAWIDIALARTGEALGSLRSDRWLGCAGVNKNLGFMLKAGVSYVLQLSEMDSETVSALIMPIPAAQ